MCRPLHRTLTLYAGLLLVAPLCPAATPAANTSGTIQQRIDALLKHRLRPEPLPVDPPNPFLVVSAAKRESADGAGSKPAGKKESAPLNPPTKLPAASNADVLAACAARLRVGGIISSNDQTHVVINGVLRKEGDIIAADWNDSVVNLRVVRLQPGQIVLRFGEAETTLKF